MSEREYLEKRAVLETMLASTAEDERVAAVHAVMAASYLKRLTAVAIRSRRAGGGAVR